MYIYPHRSKIPERDTTYATCYLFVSGAAHVRSRPGQPPWRTRWRHPVQSKRTRLRSPRAGVFEGRKQRGAAKRPAVAVSTDGGVLERKPAGGGRRVFVRQVEGIRGSPDGCAESALSQRHWIIASSACIFRPVIAPAELRKRHDRDTRPSQAALGRPGVRGQLDRRCGSFGAAEHFRSEESSRDRTRLVHR